MQFFYRIIKQDLVLFKSDSITDEIEDNVQDDDLELNKEVMGVSLGSHSKYIAIYIHMRIIYIYVHVDVCIYIYIHTHIYIYANLQTRCLEVFEKTGHVWYTMPLQQCFARFKGESWPTARSSHSRTMMCAHIFS